MAQAWAPVTRHRNLTVTADPMRVLQGACRALLVNKAQNLRATKAARS